MFKRSVIGLAGAAVLASALAGMPAHARRLEPVAIVTEVLSRRPHQPRPLAKQGQRVRDVRRASAATLVHRVNEEAQTDAMHVLRQEVLGELARKRHQIVVGNGTGDDDAQWTPSTVLSAEC